MSDFTIAVGGGRDKIKGETKNKKHVDAWRSTRDECRNAAPQQDPSTVRKREHPRTHTRTTLELLLLRTAQEDFTDIETPMRPKSFARTRNGLPRLNSTLFVIRLYRKYAKRLEIRLAFDSRDTPDAVLILQRDSAKHLTAIKSSSVCRVGQIFDDALRPGDRNNARVHSMSIAKRPLRSPMAGATHTPLPAPSRAPTRRTNHRFPVS